MRAFVFVSIRCLKMLITTRLCVFRAGGEVKDSFQRAVTPLEAANGVVHWLIRNMTTMLSLKPQRRGRPRRRGRCQEFSSRLFSGY